jgi:hypothetical protein
MVFNEIMYHPADGSTTGEWVELHNQMSIDLDISDWAFNGGIRFEFPTGTIVPARGYVVVAADPARLANEGAPGALGPFSGNLSNSGESIQLINNSGRLMDELDYRDGGSWPVGADGSGATLAKLKPLTATLDSRNWSFSSQVGGTPTTVNFPDIDDLTVDVPFVSDSAQVAVHIPLDDSLQSTWTTPNFVEGDAGESWIVGTNGIGYDDESEPVSGETYQDAVLADLPLAYWPLDESVGSNVDDVVNNHDGTATAGVQFAQDSLLSTVPLGHSLRTVGNDRVTVPSFQKFPPGSTGFTVEYWIELQSSPTGFHSIVGDGESGGDFYLMNYLTGAGRIRPHYSFANSPVSTDSNTVLQVGQTYHVATTWNQQTGDASIYIDGEHDKTVPVSTNIPTHSDNVLFFGKDNREPGGNFLLDEVAIYNYPLSAERIAAHAIAGGIDNDLSYDSLIDTDIESQLQDVNSTAYFRAAFDNDSDLSLHSLELAIQYDDGFVAYINGAEVARRNAPLNPTFNSASTAVQPKTLGIVAETIDLSQHLGLLTTGENVLAIHGLNIDASNGDFLLRPTLTAAGIPVSEISPRLVFSEISSTAEATYWIELHNDSQDPIELENLTLVSRGQVNGSYSIPSGTLPAGEYLVVNETQMGFKPSDGDRLFLFNVTGDRLVDARRADNLLRGRSNEFGNKWLYPTTATSGAANDFALESNVVINEIMYHPVTGQPEWLELTNRGPAPVDLDGWRLRNAVQYTFPVNTTINNGEFLVVTNDVATMTATYPAIDIAGPFNGTLSNKLAFVELVDANGNPADEVEYFDSGSWPAEADGFGSSLELTHVDTDNNKPLAWQPSDTSDSSPWQTFNYRGLATNGTSHPTLYNEFLIGMISRGEVLLDDIQVIEDPDGVARQLIQNGDFELDTLNSEPSHWRIIGNQQGNVVLDPAQGGNQVLHLSASGATEHRHNNAGTTLKDGNTFVTINPNLEYEISFRAKWLSGGNKLHSRLYFNRVANVSVLPLPTLSGTPGEVNSTVTTSPATTFANLAHSPIHPTANEDIAVTVELDTPAPLSSVDLSYSVDDGPYQSVAMATLGANYTALIPGQAAGSTVQFFVSATNTLGVNSQFPEAGMDSRALVRIASELDHEQLQTFQILTTPADQTKLGEWTNLMSNASLGATVIYNDEVYYDVDVRLKGSQRGRTDINRRGFRIEFSAERKFRGVHQSIGLDRSGGWRFGRTFGQDEIAIHQFLNATGNIPSLLNDLIYLDAPGVSIGPAQVQLARFEDEFLDNQFTNGSDGSLNNYELIYFPTTTVGGVEGLKNPNPDGVLGLPLQDRGDDPETYRWHFENRNNRLDDDFTGVINLNELFGETGNVFLEQADQVLDVDQWLRAFAGVTLGGVNDSYFNNSNLHNARFYTRPDDGKILLFPWDMDFAFHTSATSGIVNSPDLSRLLGSPTNHHMYLGHLDDIMDTSFNATYMQHWTDHFEDLLGQGFPAILSYIQTREGHVRSTIGNTVAPISFAITSPNQTVNSNTVTLNGNGWVDVRELRIQGATYPLDTVWTALNQWETNVTVPLGESTLVVEAFDFRGNLIGSDTVTVTSTSTDTRLVDALRITEVMYNPPSPTASEIAAGFDNNDDFEFIEIGNIGTEPINLAGVQLADAVNFTFDTVTLGPGQFIVVAEDIAAFNLRYDPNINVVGPWAGGLGNSSETITLLDPQNSVIQQFTYDDGGDWPGRADGNGSSLEPISPNGNYSDPENWRSSVEFQGTPGSAGIGNADSIVINEILSHTDLPQVDSIELFNPTPNAINIGGWYLSDSNNNYLKFRIPDNTQLGTDEYLVFDETDFNPTPPTPGPNDFALNSAHGDNVWLTEVDDNDQIIRFIDSVSFAAQSNAESWGRWPNGTGRLYPMTSRSLDDVNPGPRVGPVIISEIHYNPVDPDGMGPITASGLEFIELFNPTNSDVDLTNWGIESGIDFAFPDNYSLAAGSALVVTSFDPLTSPTQLADFLTTYSIPPETNIVGGFSGQLENAGETVRITRPDQPPLDEPLFFPALLEDELRYDDDPPWPAVETNGLSLHRAATTLWGNDPISWFSTTPTPGQVDTTPPAVVSFSINTLEVDPPDLAGKPPQPTSWQRQRSLLQSISIDFTRPVQLTSDDIELINLGIDAPNDNDQAIVVEANQVDVHADHLTITFDQRLPDGVYQLRLSADITDLGGSQNLDGNGDGTGGDGYVLTGDRDNKIYQLEAEWNGDEGVSVFDFSTFSYWFGVEVGVAGAPSYVDVNNDNGISVFDFTGFSNNFGVGVVYPVGFVEQMVGRNIEAANHGVASQEVIERTALNSVLLNWNARRNGSMELRVATEAEVDTALALLDDGDNWLHEF